MSPNIDPRTVAGFGDEWRRFDQTAVSEEEARQQFERYFGIFPWSRLPQGAEGFDMGCGSGRWARFVAPRVGRLVCIDASAEALEVARQALADHGNCELVQASVDEAPIADASMDFGYALGVLHHLPDTAAGIGACARKLRPGAPLLLYLYYAFDNRPFWYRALWRLSDGLRRLISRLPPGLRAAVSDLIAAGVYFPLARLARLLERAGRGVGGMPLAAYRSASFYTMRTDARDRFGTRLERRFRRDEIRRMMEAAGLRDIAFSDSVPYWCAVGYRKEPA